jgi:hypothetical protein
MLHNENSIQIITPSDGPSVPNAASLPLNYPSSVHGIDVQSLLGELNDPTAPLLEKTLGVIDEELAQRGQSPIGLTIGYMSRYQSSLSAASPVPVVSSPLLAVPLLLSTVSHTSRVLIIYADSTVGSRDDIPGISDADYRERLVRVGLENSRAFRSAVFERSEPWDGESVMALPSLSGHPI